MFSTIATALLHNFNYVFTTILGQLLLPYGIDDSSFTSVCGVIFIVGGVIGGIAGSALLTRYPQCLFASNILVAVLSFIVFVYFWLSARYISRINIQIACGLIGFVNFPGFTTSFELAVDQTRHLGVGEGMSCGLLNLIANTTSFLTVVAMTPSLDGAEKFEAFIIITILAGTLLVSLFLLILAKVCKQLEIRTTSSLYSKRSNSVVSI